MQTACTGFENELVIKRDLSHRLAGAEAVLDVALEDDAVGLGEPEGLIDRLQGGALRSEPWEDCGVDRAAVLVDDGEGGARVLRHGNTIPARKIIYKRYF